MDKHHEGHWECTIQRSAVDLYEAARFAESIMATLRYRSIDHDFALFRLRRALAKAEGRNIDEETQAAVG